MSWLSHMGERLFWELAGIHGGFHGSQGHLGSGYMQGHVHYVND